PAFVLSQDQTLRKNLVFFRYAASRLRRVSSAHTSALPGRDFAVPCLAKKSLRFFSTSNMVALDAENFAFSLQRAELALFIFGYDSFEPHKEIVDCFYNCSSQSMFHQDFS
ncbi:hypothetical protein, partial [uncultured Selenomonas sp.]|uniref:hypothetical protein n=1 Tax=uncultured Selenomonas sp. TaxID=159275 RepID=UPI0028D7EDFE